MKACFDALSKHKEEQKYAKTHQQLVETQERQGELGTDIAEKQAQNDLRNKNIACKALKTMYSKQVISYLLRWKQETQRAKQIKELKMK